MSAKKDAEVRAQICTLHRGKEISSLSKHKLYSLQKSRSSTESLKKRSTKILSFFASSTSQSGHLKYIRKENLIYSTFRDDEINSNAANEHAIFPSLRTTLRRL